MIAAHIAHWALTKNKRPAGEAATAVAATAYMPIEKARKKKYKQERVLQTKGSKNYTPPQPTPMEVAQANDWTAQQEWNRDQQAKADQKVIDDAKKAADDALWQTNRTNALTGAQGYGTSRLASMGMADDKYGVGALYNTRLQNNSNALSVGSDYSNAFSNTIFDDILGEVRGTQRNTLDNSFDNLISEYYGEDMFGSTADDAFLNAILDTQFGDASNFISGSLSRGQINQAQYDEAMKQLGTDKTGSMSELQDIGGDVLSGILGEIGTMRQGAEDKIAGWDFGQDIDVNKEAGRISSFATDKLAGLEGDIRNAVGDKEFFDTSGLITKATKKVGTPTTPGSGVSSQDALKDTFKNEATRQQEGSF